MVSCFCSFPDTIINNCFFALEMATFKILSLSVKSEISLSTVEIIIISFSLPWKLWTVAHSYSGSCDFMAFIWLLYGAIIPISSLFEVSILGKISSRIISICLWLYLLEQWFPGTVLKAAKALFVFSSVLETGR